ncbi:MAG: hypothetical protein KDD60_02560 [Bdellovibrionales bacterium]|nr:hypothetical protein [Bdellovibrionales bacterium]
MNCTRKYNVEFNNRSYNVELVSASPYGVTFRHEGKEYSVQITPEHTQSSPNTFVPTMAAAKSPAPTQAGSNPNQVTAPMPGLVVSIGVKVGQKVSAGEPALVLEAMKMENTVTFSGNGEVKQIHVQPGEQVEVGQLLLELKS